ncbi:MAG: Bug family tripartite tricarboxylate transporter substrate binding protein [Burkholderiaceae bacterium]
MNVRRLLVGRAAALLASAAVIACLGAPQASRAQAWPTKTVTLVVPYSVGGTVDIVGRLLAESLSRELKPHTVVVENRPGVGGFIGAGQVARAAPDGHTLLVTTVTGYAMQEQVPANKGRFNYRESLVPVSLVMEAPFVLIVGNSVPAANLKDFIAHARRNPQKLNEVTFGEGSSADFVGQLFARLTGIETTRVPYPGFGPALSDLVGGRVDLYFGIPPNVFALEGKAKPLVITSRARASYLPDVPASPEGGLPEFIVSNLYAISAPKGLPKNVEDAVSRAMNTVLKDPALVKRFQQLGLDVLTGSPDEAKRRVELEYTTWSSVGAGPAEAKKP